MCETNIVTREGAAFLLERGISAHNRGDYNFAQIFCGLAKTFFEELGDTFNAGVAEDWFKTAAIKDDAMNTESVST